MAKTNPSYTIETTFSAVNISTPASVYQFTAASDEKVQFIVKLTNAAGNGDYIVYLTRQWEGAGAVAVALGKTTFAAASGETVIEFVTVQMQVKSGDVIDVMIDGLAGDSSANGNIRIVADNPSILEQSDILSDATAFAGANVDGAITAVPAATWANGTRTLTSFGTLVADIWANSIRTLTMTVSQVLSFLEDGDDLTVLRGDTLSIPLTSLGSIATRSKLYFTARKLTIKDDSDSIIQIEETLNMLYLMGAEPVAPIVATDATITVGDQDDGDITILIKPRASKEFVQGVYEYDVEVVNVDESVHTLVLGDFTVTQDVTRATT